MKPAVATHAQLYPPDDPRLRAFHYELVLPLGLQQPLVLTIPRGRYDQLQASMDVPAQLVAPFTKGQQVGVVVNAFGRRYYEPGPGRAVYAGVRLSLGMPEL